MTRRGSIIFVFKKEPRRLVKSKQYLFQILASSITEIYSFSGTENAEEKQFIEFD